MKRIIGMLFMVLIVVSVSYSVLADTNTNDKSDNKSKTPSEETMRFITGDWKVETFLGFQAITKDDIEWPDGEKIIGRIVSISNTYYSSEDFGAEYKEYGVQIPNAQFNLLEDFSGEDFFYYFRMKPEDTKIVSTDRVQVIQAVSSGQGESAAGCMLVAVNNNRLLISLNSDLFELSKVNEANHPSPEYKSIGELGNDGLTDNQIYSFMDGDIIIQHDEQALLMLDGKFTSKAAAIIKDSQMLVPLRYISENFGAEINWIEAEQKIIILKDNDKIELKLNSAETSINKEIITLETPPVLFEGKTFVPINFISEAFGKKVGYLPAVNKSIEGALAYDTVVWIESDANTYSEDIATGEILNMLKMKLFEGLANYKELNKGGRFEKEVNNISEQIKIDIENTKYIGQVGRYALYSGPYTILVDILTNEIYFYTPINAGATLYKPDFNSSSLFGKSYIAG